MVDSHHITSGTVQLSGQDDRNLFHDIIDLLRVRHIGNQLVCGKRQIIGVYKKSTVCDILQSVLLDN